MKISRVSIQISAVLAVLSLAGGTALFLAAPAHGQGAPNAQNIAVVDIGKILKNYEKFKQEMHNMSSEIMATEKQLESEQNDIKTLVNQQKTLAAGTPDYVRLDTEITKRSADLNVQQSLKKKEYIERQSKMLYGAYSEIQDAVKEFSGRYNIGLVTQYESSPIDTSDPQAILNGAHRNVVYVNPGLDITNDILASLNRSAQRVGSTAPIGIPNTTVPGQYQPH